MPPRSNTHAFIPGVHFLKKRSTDGIFQVVPQLKITDPTCYPVPAMTKGYIPDRRGRVAEKIMDWGNLVFAGLVVSQAFSNKFSWPHAITGAVVFAGAYLVAAVMMRGGGDNDKH